MQKLRMLADRYIFNRLIFQILMVIAVMITAVPYLHVMFGGYVKFLLLYGFVIIAYEFFTGQLTEALKQKTSWLLIGFSVSYAITLLINRENALIEGVKSFAYVLVFFVLFYMTRKGQTKQTVIKELQIISAIIIFCTFVLSLFSLLSYAFSISGRYLNNEGIYVYYGLHENRLWGLYNPNTGSTLNCISLLLSVGFIATIRKGTSTFLNSLNIFLQFSCLLLTGSRAGYYIMLLTLILLTAFFIFKRYERLNLRAISIIAACSIIMSGLYVGSGLLLKEGYAYLPNLIQISLSGNYNDSSGFESEHINQNDNLPFSSDLSSDSDDFYDGQSKPDSDNHNSSGSNSHSKPIPQKQDFTRLEELESREGGFFNGRVVMWQACLGAFKESPLFGVGNENLISRSLPHLEDALWKEHFRTGGSHNIYICLLTSTGIIGFLLIGVFAAITFIKSLTVFLKNKKTSSFWLPVTIGMCFLFYISEFVEARILFQVSTFSVIFWLFVGYMYRLAKLEEKDTEK